MQVIDNPFNAISSPYTVEADRQKHTYGRVSASIQTGEGAAQAHRESIAASAGANGHADAQGQCSIAATTGQSPYYATHHGRGAWGVAAIAATTGRAVCKSNYGIAVATGGADASAHAEKACAIVNGGGGHAHAHHPGSTAIAAGSTATASGVLGSTLVFIHNGAVYSATVGDEGVAPDTRYTVIDGRIRASKPTPPQ